MRGSVCLAFDVIIVGSGLGGLSCGAALSAVGKRVLVLEKHHTVGGYIQGFTRKDWHWNVGAHYLSNLPSSKMVFDLFNVLTDRKVILDPLEPAYERILANGYAHEVCSNKDDAYLHRLQHEFPGEKKSLIRFFKLLRKIRKRNSLLFTAKLFTGFWKYLIHAVNWIGFRRYWGKTLAAVLADSFQNEQLKNILAIHCDKLMLAPSACSFLSWATIHNSYMDGACYPRGGGESISGPLVTKIEAGGGHVRTNAEVTEILIEGGRAGGVYLRSGEIIRCDKIVSNVGIFETAEKLMPRGKISHRQQKVLNKYVPSGGYMTLHLGFNGDLSPFHIENANYRIYGEHPYDFTQNPLLPGWEPQNVIITFPSIRDKSHTAKNRHSAEIICPVSYKHFAKWEKTEVNRRGSEYLQCKAQITAVLIASLERWFPGIAETIAFSDLSTPLTFEHYTGHKRGAAYGVACSVGRATDLLLHPVSDIKGLYYTGSDILSQGIAGTFVSGIFTAAALSKNYRMFRLKPKS